MYNQPGRPESYSRTAAGFGSSAKWFSGPRIGAVLDWEPVDLNPDGIVFTTQRRSFVPGGSLQRH
jgi:hypothetical protein